MAKRIIFRALKAGAEGLGKVVQKLREDGFNVIIPRKHNSMFRARPDDVEVTWGVADKNKITQFEAFAEHGVPHALWTQDKVQAQQWVQEGNKVLCRTLLNGHSGRGITVARTVEEVIDAPLYVKYHKKTREFRVHVILESLLDRTYITEKKMMQKARRPDNFVQEVRNHNNGWVFCHNTEIDGALDGNLQALAERAVVALSLDQGAVDIGYHEPTDTYIVYEVNTQPGLDNTTAAWYAEQYANLASEE